MNQINSPNIIFQNKWEKKNTFIRKLFAKFIKTMTIVQHSFLYGKVVNIDAFPVFVIDNRKYVCVRCYCSFGAKDFTKLSDRGYFCTFFDKKLFRINFSVIMTDIEISFGKKKKKLSELKFATAKGTWNLMSQSRTHVWTLIIIPLN